MPSNPSGKLVEECEKNNISKKKHEPTVDSRVMATGALLVPLNSAFLSSRILYCLSPFFFFELVTFCYFKGTFPPITFMSLIYVFLYFILFFM